MTLRSPRALGVAALVVLLAAAPGVLAGDPDEIIIDGDDDDDGPEVDETGKRCDEPPEMPSAPVATTLLSGIVQTRLALDLAWDGGGEDVFELRNRFDLGIVYEPTPNLRVAVTGRLTHRLLLENARAPGDERADLHRSWLDPELREAYLLWRFKSGLDLAIGQRIFSWGKTDFSQPLSVMNPADYRDGPMESAGTPLIPVFAVEASQRLGPINLAVVWVPFFVPNKVDLFGSDWSLLRPESGLTLPALDRPGFPELSRTTLQELVHPTRYEELQDVLLSTQEPAQDGITGSQLGVRISGNAGGVDLGAVYAYVWDRVPVWTVDEGKLRQAYSELAAGASSAYSTLAEAIDGQYERRHVIGGEIGLTLGDFGFKGDVSFSPERTFYDDAYKPLRKPALFWAVQVDYLWHYIINVSIELSHLAVFGLESDDELLLVDADFILLTALAQMRFGGRGQFQVGVTANYGLSNGDTLLSPEFVWRVSGGWTMAAGMALVLRGSDGTDRVTTGGLYDNNDHAYVTSTVSF